MSRVTVCYIAHIIVSITSLYLVHAFSNLSKLPFLDINLLMTTDNRLLILIIDTKY